jgi:hypothetical protein
LAAQDAGVEELAAALATAGIADATEPEPLAEADDAGKVCGTT